MAGFSSIGQGLRDAARSTGRTEALRNIRAVRAIVSIDANTARRCRDIAASRRRHRRRALADDVLVLAMDGREPRGILDPTGRHRSSCASTSSTAATPRPPAIATSFRACGRRAARTLGGRRGGDARLLLQSSRAVPGIGGGHAAGGQRDGAALDRLADELAVGHVSTSIGATGRSDLRPDDEQAFAFQTDDRFADRRADPVEPLRDLVFG